MLLCVLAKEPRPGFVKTRLCPPCSPDQAAELAAACLVDTLRTVVATDDARPLVVLDGEPGPWLPPGIDVLDQVDGDLGRRLDAAVAAAFDLHPAGPVVVIGMDTPQVRPADLIPVGALLGAGTPPTADAVLGMATDGGYWLIGFRQPVPGAFDGVPMSTSGTGAAQVRRLSELGCRVLLTRKLVDVDDIASARRVAHEAPTTTFAATLRRVDHQRSV